MSLLLKQNVFEIESATLSAALPDLYWSKKYNPKGHAGLFWSISIQAQEGVVGEQYWHPRAYHENLRLPVRRWIELGGQKVCWTEPYDEETDEANGGLYVFEHGDIGEANLNFLERDNTLIHVHWNGLCDIFFDANYGKNVPFDIDTWVEFTGVIVHGSELDNEETLSTRLAAYLDIQDLKQQSMQFNGHAYQDGVKMASSHFVPKTSQSE